MPRQRSNRDEAWPGLFRPSPHHMCLTNRSSAVGRRCEVPRRCRRRCCPPKEVPEGGASDLFPEEVLPGGGASDLFQKQQATSREKP